MKGGLILRKVFHFLNELAELYSKKRIARASAALSYYLTMTIFPMIICLYSLLGMSHRSAIEVLELAEDFLAAETVIFIHTFLDYVASAHSHAMLIAGLTVLLSSASAGIRTVQATIGEIQGGQRFQGLTDFVFSVIFSAIFLAAMYFAILVILTGQEFLAFVSRIFPFIDPGSSWKWIRFLILGGIELVIFWGVYEASKRRSDKYSTIPGALVATVGTVAMSFAFSVFIGASTRYPLVYGSLASMILLMFWLYLCCQIIYIGAAFNVVLRNRKRRGEDYRTNMGQK